MSTTTVITTTTEEIIVAPPQCLTMESRMFGTCIDLAALAALCLVIFAICISLIVIIYRKATGKPFDCYSKKYKKRRYTIEDPPELRKAVASQSAYSRSTAWVLAAAGTYNTARYNSADAGTSSAK